MNHESNYMLLGSSFDPEYGEMLFLHISRISTDCTALHLILHSHRCENIKFYKYINIQERFKLCSICYMLIGTYKIFHTTMVKLRVILL
jgi:hypothetical protein